MGFEKKSTTTIVFSILESEEDRRFAADMKKYPFRGYSTVKLKAYNIAAVKVIGSLNQQLLDILSFCKGKLVNILEATQNLRILESIRGGGRVTSGGGSPPWVNNLPTPVRQRTARSAENIAAVRVSVQENPRQSIPRRAQEHGLSQTSTFSANFAFGLGSEPVQYPTDPGAQS
ncbi:hypothetical protein NQ318_013028 [Aromia moschata]|uniref:Uncharacterized protein n=1 Tax=Aromia moschata TaxID=1265417 RepID=A0AAV8Y4Y0_9CUCU|nr:hypothetical protein NQ318_013028 [Aromia moschata]